jgi:hypothetical protein
MFSVLVLRSVPDWFTLASMDPPPQMWLLPRATLADLSLTLGRLAIAGFLAIGVSGVVAAGMGATFGESFVAGDPPGLTYTTDRCADFFEYAPTARSCEEAATTHHFGEVVDYRLAAGVLGLLGLIPYAWLRRRLRGNPSLPPGFEATVGTTLYGAAAVFLLASSVNGFVLGETAGVGGYLSGGIVVLVLGGYYAISLYRTLLKGSVAARAPV